MKTKLSGEIGDRVFDRTACPGFSIGVLARKIIAERVVDFLQFAQESFVLRNFLQPRLPRKLKHADGIMVCPVPKLRIELPEQAAGGGLPRPPKIKTHLTQRLERRRQGRSHVVSLKSRHANLAGETERELIKKTSSGKFSSNGGLVQPRPRSSTAANGRGARISPRKKPATNPQRCAAMLTCGVERSNAV